MAGDRQPARRRIAIALALALAACGASPPGATLTLTTQPVPLGLGQNRFAVTVVDVAGQPVTDAEVAISLVMPADPATNHPEMRTEGVLNNAGGGQYTGIAMVTMAGEWEVSVTARRGSAVLGTRRERLAAVAIRP